MIAARDDAGGGTGSARRRRERRLRAYLKSARMSVAVALAECQHHSAQRQRTATGRRCESIDPLDDTCDARWISLISDTVRHVFDSQNRRRHVAQGKQTNWSRALKQVR